VQYGVSTLRRKGLAADSKINAELDERSVTLTRQNVFSSTSLRLLFAELFVFVRRTTRSIADLDLVDSRTLGVKRRGFGENDVHRKILYKFLMRTKLDPKQDYV